MFINSGVPDTVILCSAPPTSSAAFTSRRSRHLQLHVLTNEAFETGRSAVTLYRPGISRGAEYNPSPLVFSATVVPIA